MNRTREGKESDKEVVLLAIAGWEKFYPFTFDTAAGVVGRMQGTIEKTWNVVLRLAQTLSALPQEVKDAVAN